MKKSKYVKIIFFCVVLTVGLWYGRAKSQQVQPNSEQRITLGIGRDNPFAKISSKENFISQNVSRSLQSGLESPDLFVETVTLKFLDAKNLRTAIAGMVSEHGIISIDGKSNSLIVCDTKENLEKILTQIKKADRTPKQIMVEVVILDVQLDDDTEIGINWDLLSDKNYGIGYRQNFTASGERLGSTIDSAANIGAATAFNTTGLGGDFSIISSTIRNIVHLIQQKRDVEILASPRVMMVSGQTANIEAVDEIPYTEATSSVQGGEFTYTEFKLVGVKLQVTATLTDGNDILLTVDAEQNVQVGTSTPPRVDTRKAKTSLLLKDGEVVVFGGLRRQEKTKEVDQIPLLGDLPIIGGLFKSTNTVVKNSELIVFLSPHIYKGEPPPKEQMAKYKEISERPILSLPKEDKKKNGWFSQSDKQPQGK